MSRLVDRTKLEALIDKLDDLKPSYKEYMKDRWLAVLERWDLRAARTKWKHYLLRGIIVTGGVVLPALIGTAAVPSLLDENKNAIQWIAFGLSVLVGIAASLEGLFRWGEIWRDKRAAEELLNCEGHRYMQLIGKYKGRTHNNSYHDFASTVEDIIEHEIKDYLLVTRTKDEEPK